MPGVPRVERVVFRDNPGDRHKIPRFPYFPHMRIVLQRVPADAQEFQEGKMAQGNEPRENPHEGHRARMREEFRRAGLESLQPHRVLELLLFYAVPRRDTNELAHALLERFGSLKDVLAAPYEELRRVEGIGEAAATLVVFAAQLARRYSMEQGGGKISFESRKEFHAYALSLFFGADTERAFLLCMDNAGRLNHSCAVSLGTKYAVSLDNRSLLEAAFRHGATKVALAHNHPNGLAAPSKEDVACTQAAAELFRSVSITLLDHLIVANGECFSMAATPRFGRIFLTGLTP
jgi:DNA repair protein RadC